MIDDKKEMKYNYNSPTPKFDFINLSFIISRVYILPLLFVKISKKKEMTQRLKNTTEIIRSLT